MPEIEQRCKNCKHWGDSRPASHVGAVHNWHELTREYHDCKHPKFGAKEPTPDGVVTSADDPYCYENVCTGPSFGCIHWESKT